MTIDINWVNEKLKGVMGFDPRMVEVYDPDGEMYLGSTDSAMSISVSLVHLLDDDENRVVFYTEDSCWKFCNEDDFVNWALEFCNDD